MLSYILATIVGLGSVAFYLSAFFFPEVYRKGDFIWSGIGFFYALVLWFCAGQIGGAVLLGQTASVALLGWLGWQTLKLRRDTTPLAEQTSAAAIAQSGLTPSAIADRVTQAFSPGKKVTPPVTPTPTPEVTPTAPDPIPDAAIEAIETATELPVVETAEDDWEERAAPIAEESQEPPEIADDSLTEDFPVTAAPEAIAETPLETTPIAPPAAEWETDPLDDDFEEVASAPAPTITPSIPTTPPLTPSMQPKSRTFGFLASLTDRLKGLLGKDKPKSPPPVPTAPLAVPEPEDEMDEPDPVSPEPIAFTEAIAEDVTETAEVAASPVPSEVAESLEAPSVETATVSEAEFVEDAKLDEVADASSENVVEMPEPIEVSESESIQEVDDPVASEESVSEDADSEDAEDAEIVEVVVSQTVEVIELSPRSHESDVADSPDADSAETVEAQEVPVAEMISIVEVTVTEAVVTVESPAESEVADDRSEEEIASETEDSEVTPEIEDAEAKTAPPTLSPKPKKKKR